MRVMLKRAYRYTSCIYFWTSPSLKDATINLVCFMTFFFTLVNILDTFMIESLLHKKATDMALIHAPY